MRFLASVAVGLLAFASSFGGTVETYAAKIAPLVNPTKLATLKERGANPRVQKVVYWLAIGKVERAEPSAVIDAALKSVGIKGKAAELTKEAVLRNLKIAESLDCLDAAGLSEMRKGNAPTVGRGPCKGDQLSVDHIIPRAVAPELDNVIANLELMPMRLNSRKKASVGDRQVSLAVKLHEAGLLSERGLAAVLTASGKSR